MPAPDRGDIIWLPFDQGRGHEQAGRRPALVLSPRIYNQTVGLAVCCPITSMIKRYPFEIEVHEGRIDGAVLCDQIRSIDWRARRARLAGTASPEVLEGATALVRALIDPDG